MATTQVKVEAIPKPVFVEERDSGRRVDFWFAIENDGAEELTLVAIEQDVYDVDGGLLQARLVDGTGSPIRAGAGHGSRIGSGFRRTIGNPLPEFDAGTPLAALVYTFSFRTAAGEMLDAKVRVAPVAAGPAEPVIPPQALPLERARGDEQQPAPTPRQLARVWFETLYELNVYASSPAGLS